MSRHASRTPIHSTRKNTERKRARRLATVRAVDLSAAITDVEPPARRSDANHRRRKQGCMTTAPQNLRRQDHRIAFFRGFLT